MYKGIIRLLQMLRIKLCDSQSIPLHTFYLLFRVPIVSFFCTHFTSCLSLLMPFITRSASLYRCGLCSSVPAALVSTLSCLDRLGLPMMFVTIGLEVLFHQYKYKW